MHLNLSNGKCRKCLVVLVVSIEIGGLLINRTLVLINQVRRASEIQSSAKELLSMLPS